MPDETETKRMGDSTLRNLLAADVPTARIGPPEAADAGGLTEKPGDFIGRYKLLEKIGEGGFGAVWRAEQSEPIRREVALKVIKAGMDSAVIIARFGAERQALARMDHPNIAAVIDAGTAEGGRPFFAMELVKGVPITEYADAHQLTIRQRLELFIPVCYAVQHAHQKAILHRDLKPSNILVMEVDGKPVPKVIDFGIAKALGTSPEDALEASLHLTQTGSFIGTPRYMSPEQAGATGDMDTRSDIYTLGVILYELLTGDTPLPREALRQAALHEVLRMIRESDPARPSSRIGTASDATRATSTARATEPSKLNRTLRGDLDWITLKALEKERDRRYESAAALAQDLQRHLGNEPVEAGPPSAGYRLRKFVRRNQLAVGAAAAIFVLLVAGIAVSTWQAVRATRAEKLAEGRRIQAEDAATHARENLSWSDFLQALRWIDEDKSYDALAQLAHSLVQNSRNDAALCRLVTLLTLRDFALPVWGMNYSEAIWSAQFSADGKRIVTADGDNIRRVWDAQNGKPTKLLEQDAKIKPIPVPLKSDDTVRSNPDGKRNATREGNTVRVSDAQSGNALAGILKHDGWIESAGFSSEGKWILTASHDTTARVWDAQSGKPLKEPMKHDDEAWSAQLSPDGKQVVTVSGNAAGGIARMWNVQSGKALTEPLKHNEEVQLAQFSLDGTRVVTTTSSGKARTWDAQSGKPLTAQLKQNNLFKAVEISPDGKRKVAAEYDDKTARILDAQSGQILAEPMKHDAYVYSAVFSSDGKRIVTASWDTGWGAARLWDAQSGKPLTEPLKHSAAVPLAQFSPDGKQVVTASSDKTARIWDISPRGPAPEWLPRLADAVAGQHLNDRGVFEPLKEDPGRVLDTIRAQLNSAPDDDDWTIWGRWFLADRSTRTISPFSKITVPEYIENRIKENTPESLDEAERLVVGNRGLLQRIEEARAALMAVADKAASLSPTVFRYLYKGEKGEAPVYMEWTRKGSVWEEKPPSGAVKVLDVDRQDKVDGRSGSVLTLQGDKGFRVFVSNKDEPDPQIYFWLNDKQQWDLLGKMENVR